MPIANDDSSLGRLRASTTQSELLENLKTLKNAIIGNTWKKLEIAEDEATLSL
jgi:hypothetical protein